MWQSPPSLRCPGLFITATDTGVGKTVITCAIAAALRSQNPQQRVGVCKPFASGCRHEREGLVSQDAEALAHFADCRLPLDVINPIRFAAPLAPAAAAQRVEQTIDWDHLAHCLARIDQSSDCLLIEGVGGLMVPLDPKHPRCTVLDPARALDYPVLIVTRSGLGTLNHTTMTARLLKSAGLRVAGIVMNQFDADSHDLSMADNRTWIEKLCGCPVLTTVPQCLPQNVQVHKAILDPAILEAITRVDWQRCTQPPRT
ncbi:MAG: dethiobiotin synthase [Phycisphaeraceae bacterium]|nr:dethiobiotin synthase [Phycisphaeraceae bacterium]